MNRLQRNRAYLTALFAGEFPGHALIYEPIGLPSAGLGDYVAESGPVELWVEHYLRRYEARLAASETLDDDGVPYVNLCGTTGFFASAFGCPLHVYESGGSAPAARPIVNSAAEADALPEPDLAHRTFQRYFELTERLREHLPPEAPISVPDIQSPFGIAAQIWNKEDMLVALLESPGSVHRLVEKTHRLLAAFLRELLRRIPNVNLCHCPYTWAPPELGCWLSEDEIGIISPGMFEEFCLPSLQSLSREFGGLFMHCCARAEQHYSCWSKIPNLRGINPKFFEAGPKPLLEMHVGKVVMMGWTPVEQYHRMLDLAPGGARFLFNLSGKSIEQAKPIYARLRERCPRRSQSATRA